MTEGSRITIPEGVTAGIQGIGSITAGIGGIGGIVGVSAASPRRNSFSPYDVANNQTPGGVAVPWRRPWQSQVGSLIYLDCHLQNYKLNGVLSKINFFSMLSDTIEKINFTQNHQDGRKLH